MEEYIILSPDGFPIHPTNTYTEKEITTAFVNWKSNYQDQGYYSSVPYGRIQLDELEKYCEIVKIK